MKKKGLSINIKKARLMATGTRSLNLTLKPDNEDTEVVDSF